MPPPNFARKKGKSHSRGSSAKRTTHRSSTSGKSDLRSSSVDITSIGSTSKEGIDNSKLLNDIQLKETVPLSNKAQVFKKQTSGLHISSTEESLQKNSPSKKRVNKKASKKNTDSCEYQLKSEASDNSSVNNFETVNSTSSMKMVKEDNLNKLSELMERLSSTYKVDTCDSSSLGKVNSQTNNSFNKPLNSSLFKNRLEENHSTKESCNEENMTQEEKQALRKARKEAKKSGKSSASVVKQTSNSVDSISQASKCEAANQILTSETSIKSEKSKSDLKRERREKQEAQRAAKLTAKIEKENPVQKINPIQKLPVSEKLSASPKIVPSKKKDVSKSRRRLPLFEHLPLPKTDDDLSSFNEARIHPAIRTSGICMKDMKIDGSLARVIATLSSVYSLIEDYRTPSSCDLSRDLSDYLSSNIAFLNACRPLSEPVNNAIRFVKKAINEIESTVPESQAKETLLSSIENFIHQNISLASESLVQNALDFIEDNDVILTYGMSHLVKDTISEASKLKENLSVVVADNPSTGSGLHFVKSLSHLKIGVHYRILSDLAQIMKRVTKVIVEAEAVVLNGAVIGHCGLASLILLAKFKCVPVIVLSHTFKFCNIDLTDSLVVNELGDPSVIVNCPSRTYNKALENWKETPNLNVVNLMFDVTPPDLINVLVTERSNYPTSVVPVIIRRNYADILGHD